MSLPHRHRPRALQRLRRLRRHRPRRPSRWATTASPSPWSASTGRSRGPGGGASLPDGGDPRPGRLRRARSSEVDATDVLIAGAGLAGSRCAETLRAGRVRRAHRGRRRGAPRALRAPGALEGAAQRGRAAGEPGPARRRASGPAATSSCGSASALGGLDLGARRARVGGEPMRWRHLVLATGAAGAPPPDAVPVAANVHHLRDLDDARALRADLARGGRLVIDRRGVRGRGGGLERDRPGRRGDHRRGASPSVRGDPRLRRGTAPCRPLPRGRRRSAARRRGSRTSSVRRGRVRAVRAGRREPAPLRRAPRRGRDARPAADLAAGLVELAADGGVPTDPLGGTAVPGVHACGDVASPWRPELGRHARLEHWTAAASGRRGGGAGDHGSRRPRRPRRRTSGRTSSAGGSR